MIDHPKALLIKFPGTNCDSETARALEVAGFSTEVLPSSELTAASLVGAHLVVFSGGFSYGDYVMSGRIAQLILESRIDQALKEFVAAGGYVLGICNGFQILTKLGLLPSGALIDNTSGRFQCRWVKLRVQDPKNPYLRELPADIDIEMPIAHAEGRFVAPEGAAEAYCADLRAALTYSGENPNGSQSLIAGLSDTTGRVFGLMPHPERFIWPTQHYDPDWAGDAEFGWGYYLFKSVYRDIRGERQFIA
jgi:phosphoribosylformylglycinamidine synthase subunit PurQ / glutaminase